MARPDPPSSNGRLAAVLGAVAPPGPRARREPPTEPLPVLPRVEPERARGSAARGVGLSRFVPAVWRAARWDPGRPGAMALVLVAAVAAIAAAIGVWSDRPRAEPVAALPSVSAAAPEVVRPDAAGPVQTSAAPAVPLVVSVSGKVARPGLVEVRPGARVADVLAAAGGALPGTDLTGLNLARRVADGEQIAVGVPAAPGPVASPGEAPAAGAPPGKVDLNSATVPQLDALPGVGPVTAERIVEWRTRNGRFARVEQLREIEGIGERRFGRLRELVSV